MIVELRRQVRLWLAIGGVGLLLVLLGFWLGLSGRATRRLAAAQLAVVDRGAAIHDDRQAGLGARSAPLPS